MLLDWNASEPYRLTGLDQDEGCPVWSLSGGLAYCAQWNGLWELRRSLPDGGQLLLVSGLASIRSPSWSPDGLHLVFQGIDLDGNGLFLVNQLGEDLHRLTGDATSMDGSPAWSPVR
jgi:hypothetical protein